MMGGKKKGAADAAPLFCRESLARSEHVTDADRDTLRILATADGEAVRTEVAGRRVVLVVDFHVLCEQERALREVVLVPRAVRAAIRLLGGAVQAAILGLHVLVDELVVA